MLTHGHYDHAHHARMVADAFGVPVYASEKEEVTMSEKLVDIKAFMMEHEAFSFRELLWNNPSKVAVIVTFLVVLELIKTGFVEVKQECPEDDIFIRVVRDPELIEDITEE